MEINPVDSFILGGNLFRKKQDEFCLLFRRSFAGKIKVVRMVNKIPNNDSSNEKFAAEHESWICPRCETINSNSNYSCLVCGYSNGSTYVDSDAFVQGNKSNLKKVEASSNA